jgi:hypothetical protein
MRKRRAIQDQGIVEPRRSKAARHSTALKKLEDHRKYVMEDTITGLVVDFSNDSSIDLDDRIFSLLKLLETLSNTVSRLIRNVPEVAPAFWRNRDKSKNETPIEFIATTYADFLGTGLTQADIRQLDFDLYRALHNWKQRHGWPKDFDFPSRRESNDQLLERYLGQRLSRSALKQAPVTLRLDRRLYEAARNRLRKKG